MSRRLALEYRDILKNLDENIMVNARYRGIRGKHYWDCEIFTHEYKSAYRYSLTKLTLKFPVEYPFKPPMVTFKTPIFHPYIHDMSGYFCGHVLPYFWTKTNNDEGSNGLPWRSKNTAKYILELIATLLADEGSSLKNIQSLCQNHSISYTRDTEYCLFDKIIQRCLGNEFYDDQDLNDPFFDKATLKQWGEQVADQRALNAIQSELCAEMFAGRLPEIETITRRFLGLVTGPKSEEFQSVQTLSIITIPEEESTLVSNDGTIITCPKWSTLELIYSLNGGGNIPTILSTDMIQQVLSLCHVRESVKIRKYNQMDLFFDEEINEKYLIMSSEETWDLLNAANFLGGHEIVLGCCLRLCKFFVYNSRIQYTVNKLKKFQELS